MGVFKTIIFCNIFFSYDYLCMLFSYEGHSEIFEIRADENLQNKNNGLILKYEVF